MLGEGGNGLRRDARLGFGLSDHEQERLVDLFHERYRIGNRPFMGKITGQINRRG